MRKAKNTQTYFIHANIFNFYTPRLSFLVIFLIAMVCTFALSASAELVKREHETKIKPYSVEPLNEWTTQEKWVWECICAGEIADFNKIEIYGGKLDPKKSEGWQENRVLRSIFLETILLREPFRSALTYKGVRINGSWFTESLNLSTATLTQLLYLNNSRFEKDIDFSELRTSHTISLEGSKIIGTLEMSFLETNGSLLINEAEFSLVKIYKSQIDGDLSLNNSRFTDMLIMSSIKVKGNLNMDNNTFEIQETMMKDFFTQKKQEPSAVFLTNAEVGNLYIYGCKFISPKSEFNKLNMKTLKVYGYLHMEGDSKFGEVDLLRANIGGQIIISNSEFKGKLNMDSLEVRGDLLIRGNLKFAEVDIHSAEICGQLEIKDAKFVDILNMSSIKVKTNLSMDNNTFEIQETIMKDFFSQKKQEPGAVFLTNAEVGNLYIYGCKFISPKSEFNKLNMNFIKVKNNVTIENELIKEVFLLFGKIGQNLDISKGRFFCLNLAGTQINGELQLISENGQTTQWSKEAILILRNTEVGTIRDSQDSWPDNLELDGFIYKNLGGFTVNNRDNIAIRNSTWLAEWLAKQKEYSPLPYEQLASILQKTGYKDKAEDILYKSKELERNETSRWKWNWSWLTFQKWTIGYGYHLYYSIYHILALLTLGSLLIYKTWRKKYICDCIRYSQSARCTDYYHIASRILNCLSYSLDMMIPFLVLDKRHYDLEVHGVVKYYFYIHKSWGFIVITIVLAGLSGLMTR